MSEQEIKNLLAVYQQKVSELTAQTIAFEARIMNLNQVIESLNKKVLELQENQEKEATKRNSKKTEDFT